VDMQVLFVLGSIGETFEINGLSHFPMDIEYSVEQCHRTIVPSGSAVFQAGGLIVVLVEVARKAYLASIVPVIVNTILNEHQIVVDIVAFVNKGDFPRSRLGEKQRGKVLATWVTRKMRTMAQFGIRDAESALSNVAEINESRSGSASGAAATSFRNGSVMASSLRNSDVPPHPAEFEDQRNSQGQAILDPTAGIAEMPAHSYNDSNNSETTPTSPKHPGQFELPAIDISSMSDDPESGYMSMSTSSSKPPPISKDEPSPPKVGPKPLTLGLASGSRPFSGSRLGTASKPLGSPLPSVDGRHAGEGDLYGLPSQRPVSHVGGLRVQNVASDDDDDDARGDGDDWGSEAIMHMNLASSAAHERRMSGGI